MPLLLWAVALAVLAATLCFDAQPGINWPLWAIPAAAGLYHFAGHARRDVALPLALGAIYSAGAAISANNDAHVAILVACVLFFSFAMRIAAGAALEEAGRCIHRGLATDRGARHRARELAPRQ